MFSLNPPASQLLIFVFFGKFKTHTKQQLPVQDLKKKEKKENVFMMDSCQTK